MTWLVTGRGREGVALPRGTQAPRSHRQASWMVLGLLPSVSHVWLATAATSSCSRVRVVRHSPGVSCGAGLTAHRGGEGAGREGSRSVMPHLGDQGVSAEAGELSERGAYVASGIF